jgi:hypothetical protein
LDGAHYVDAWALCSYIMKCKELSTNPNHNSEPFESRFSISPNSDIRVNHGSPNTYILTHTTHTMSSAPIATPSRSTPEHIVHKSLQRRSLILGIPGSSVCSGGSCLSIHYPPPPPSIMKTQQVLVPYFNDERDPEMRPES